MPVHLLQTGQSKKAHLLKSTCLSLKPHVFRAQTCVGTKYAHSKSVIGRIVLMPGVPRLA